MPTVSKNLADKLKDNNGYYMDDPRVVMITEYDNQWGGVGYGLTYEHRPMQYTETEYVRNPRVYWEAKRE